MPRAHVRPPTQSAVFRRFPAKACPEDALRCSEQGLLQRILFGNLNPCESRDYTVTELRNRGKLLECAGRAKRRRRFGLCNQEFRPNSVAYICRLVKKP